MEFVSILMGSKSDYSVMKTTAEILEKFGVQYELIVSSHTEPLNEPKNILKMPKKEAQKFLSQELDWQHILLEQLLR